MSSTSSKGQDIVRLIEKAYQTRYGIFSDINNLLEYQVPDDVSPGSTKHARFYFYLIFNDHGTKSINLYSRFKQLFTESPCVFDPEYIATKYKGKEDMFKDKYLSSLGLRYPSQAAKSWIANSEKLISEYSGEPINLFLSSKSAKELYKAILSFRSYGPKTSGLLLRVIMGVGFNRELSNISEVPLPVDIHDSRIAFMCGLYNPDGVVDIQQIYSSPAHIKNIESIWRESANIIGVDWEEIDRALWLLGSIGCMTKRCGECPVSNYCSTGKDVLSNNENILSD